MKLFLEFFPRFEPGRLIQALYWQQREFPGSQLGVGTGWSGPKILQDHPAFSDVRPLLEAAIARALPPDETMLDLCAWGNVMKPGDVVSDHDHQKSHLGGPNRLAGVFYLSGGSNFFLRIEQEHYAIRPVAGLLIIFGADKPHRVDPAKEERISISFNVRVKAKTFQAGLAPNSAIG